MDSKGIKKLCLNGLACARDKCQLWVKTNDLEGTCTFKAVGYELYTINENLEKIEKRLQELRIRA